MARKNATVSVFVQLGMFAELRINAQEWLSMTENEQVAEAQSQVIHATNRWNARQNSISVGGVRFKDPISPPITAEQISGFEPD